MSKAAEEIINNTINVTTDQKDSKVKLVKRANCEYFEINGYKAGPMGGSDAEKQNNLRCIKFMVDNCKEQENGRIITEQCAQLMKIMANLEKVSLNDIININAVDYTIDCNLKQVYAENGQLTVNLAEIYPELSVELSTEAIRAILIGELNKNLVAPVAYHGDPEEVEGEINISKESKLSALETIKGLRALGLSSSWFNVEGIRQSFPICYNGKADLGEFTKIVKDAVENDKHYLDIILTSCRAKENGLDNLDEETLVINNIHCIIDYSKKELWNENVIFKFASLEDIEYDLPREAVKVMLIERAKKFIESLNSDDCCDDEESEDDDGICYYDDESTWDDEYHFQMTYILQ